MTLYKWSQSASADATADSTINWAEGQAPSSVNDSARAMMAATAKYRDDIAGAIVTGGTSTAYTVASFQIFDTLAHMNGAMLAFTPHTTNGAVVTLNVDSLGAKPLRSAPSTEILAGVLIQGTAYIATYNNSDGAWYLQSFFGNPFNVPLASGMDYWGASAPAGFAFPIGQAISRTTYATLFSLIGTTYGTGDWTTTFNLPDKTGRVSAMKEASATRLTIAGSGVDGGALGAVGGAQNVSLAANQIPTITAVNAAQSIAVSSNVSNVGQGSITTIGAGGGATLNCFSAGATSGTLTSSASNSISATYTNSSQVATKTVQPTIVCNYIMRII
jgi:microcystin-dependent protein